MRSPRSALTCFLVLLPLFRDIQANKNRKDSAKEGRRAKIMFPTIHVVNDRKMCLVFGCLEIDLFKYGSPLKREEGGTRGPAPPAAARRRSRCQRASVGKISAKCCSFSAVSAPIFARKYAFCSIFQNLPDSQAEIFEI